MRFGLTVQELEELQDKNEEQMDFLKYYYLKMPVSISKSVMNKICWRIEDEFDNFKSMDKNDSFDFNILKTNKKYSKGRYNAIKKLYHDYVSKIQEFAKISKIKRISIDDRKIHKKMLREGFKSQVYGLCNDAEELCNIVIDICYGTNKSKQFAWDICGDIIIQNLLKNNNYIVSYPVIDECGDIEYGGEKFSMLTKEVEDEDSIK